MKGDGRCLSMPVAITLHLHANTTNREPIKMSTVSQKEFDAKYITTTEIIETLEVSRSTVHVARTQGKLPDAINIHGQMYIWERKRVAPYLAAWKMMLERRREVAA